MSRFARAVLIWALAVATLATRPGMAEANRIVSATVMCGIDDAGKPTVSVTLVNHTSARLVVSYVHGFTTPRTFTVRLRPVAPDSFKSIAIANGETSNLIAPWDDLTAGDGDSGGALIVTNVGVLTPICGAASPDELTLGPAPASRAGAKLESAKLAATTLGQLEAWRAYSALYAMLHPDARAEVSFDAIACWYAGQYGTADAPDASGVVSTTVDGVSFGAWTWSTNGRRYADAATIKVTQQIGAKAAANPVTTTEHLVQADGQWRWFFGSSRASLAAMPTKCGLDAAAASATPAPAKTPRPTATPKPKSTATAKPASIATAQAAAELGSITVSNYVCPVGMTLANLVRDDCSLDQSAARWTLTGHPIKGPRTWSQTTQHGESGHAWSGLPFGEYVVNPAALPAGVTFYAIGGSDNIARQDKGIAVTLGPSEPNIRLDTYLIAPENATATPVS
jgi:hypothetical protein